MKKLIIMASLAFMAVLSGCSQEASEQQVVQNTPTEEAVNTVLAFTPPADIAHYAEGFVYEYEGVGVETLPEGEANKMAQEVEGAMAVAQYQSQNPESDEMWSISRVYVEYADTLRQETIEALKPLKVKEQRGETVTIAEVEDIINPLFQSLHKASMQYLYMMDKAAGYE